MQSENEFTERPSIIITKTGIKRGLDEKCVNLDEEIDDKKPKLDDEFEPIHASTQLSIIDFEDVDKDDFEKILLAEENELNSTGLTEAKLLNESLTRLGDDSIVIENNVAATAIMKDRIEYLEKESKKMEHKLAGKEQETARKGASVAVKIVNEHNPTITYGRQFDSTNVLYSTLTRASIDALKMNFKDKLEKELLKKKSSEHPEASRVAKLVMEHTHEIIEYDEE